MTLKISSSVIGAVEAIPGRLGGLDFDLIGSNPCSFRVVSISELALELVPTESRTGSPRGGTSELDGEGTSVLSSDVLLVPLASVVDATQLNDSEARNGYDSDETCRDVSVWDSVVKAGARCSLRKLLADTECHGPAGSATVGRSGVGEVMMVAEVQLPNLMKRRAISNKSEKKDEVIITN